MSIEHIKNYLIDKSSSYINRHTIEKNLAEPAIELLKLKRHLNMNVEGEGNVYKAAAMMKNHSALITFNHLSIFDLLPIFLITQDGYGENVQYTYPASSKFFDGSFENSFITSMIHVAAEKYNIDLYQVFQHGGHQKPAEKKIVKSSDIANPNIGILKKMKKKMLENGNVVVMSQEGGRSREGRMIEAQRPIDFFVTPNSFVQPFAIWGTEHIHGVGNKTFNPFAQINVVVGEPITHNELHAEAEMWNYDVTTIASLHTAVNLPDEYKGFYGPGNFVDWYQYYYKNGSTF